METQHFAAITGAQRVGELLRAIDGYVGQPSVTFALKLVVLVFVRPDELRRTREHPVSEVTLSAALRRLGYDPDDQTAHGFRTVASTLLNEQGWHPDLIELQSAHAERNKVRAACNRAQRLDERR